MITLKQFVKETLREIVEGIKEAQDIPSIGGSIAPKGIGGMKFPEDSGVIYEARILATSVKFDVAVTAESKKEGNASAGIAVGVFSAKLGGAGDFTNTQAHRISFSVPIAFPINKQEWHKSGLGNG